MTPYYQRDGITIYHGDMRVLLPLLGVTFNAAIADVPYNQTSLPWDRWPTGWLKVMAAWTVSMWCFGSLRMFMERRDEFLEAGWKLSQDIVWEKHNGSSFHADRFRRIHEQAAHFYQGPWETICHSVPITKDATARTVRTKSRPAHMGQIERTPYKSEDGGPRLRTSVIYAPSMHGEAENETQKPEILVQPLIEYVARSPHVICSPFMGSGTDLAVAHAMSLKAVGFDVREEQCEKAACRIAALLPMEFSA